MDIPIINSLRGVMFAMILVSGFGIIYIKNNSKDKIEYEKSRGVIEYLDTKFQDLPNRNVGDYRYLKIDSYIYTFEIYKPNSQQTEKTIDNLKVGDTIEIYYYETSDTKNSQINRYTQFMEKDKEPYFIRNAFQVQAGYVIISLSFLFIIIAFVFYKYGKIEW